MNYSTPRGPRGQVGSASKDDGWVVSRYGVLIGKYASQKKGFNVVTMSVQSDHGSDELTKLLVPETLAEAQVARWHCGSESMEEIPGHWHRSTTIVASEFTRYERAGGLSNDGDQLFEAQLQ